MAIPLSAMARRARKSRKREVTLRQIIAPATFASDLYAAAYAPVIAVWNVAAERIVAEYERTLSAMTADSPADIGQVLSGVDGELLRIVLSVRLRLEQWALRTERWHRGKWRGAVLSATAVDIGTMLGAEPVRDMLGAAVERNVGLVKSVSEQARQRISDAVFRGLTNRTPARDVAKQITEATGMARRRAVNIASDQLTKLTSALDAERRREAGIDTFEWVHSGKVHPRPEHEARNGKRYSDDDPPADMPGELPFCGCTSRAVLSLDGEF